MWLWATHKKAVTDDHLAVPSRPLSAPVRLRSAASVRVMLTSVGCVLPATTQSAWTPTVLTAVSHTSLENTFFCWCRRACSLRVNIWKVWVGSFSKFIVLRNNANVRRYVVGTRRKDARRPGNIRVRHRGGADRGSSHHHF